MIPARLAAIFGLLVGRAEDETLMRLFQTDAKDGPYRLTPADCIIPSILLIQSGFNVRITDTIT